MCIRVPYSVSCMIALLACISEHIAAIFFARNGIHRNTKKMLKCFLYEKTRLNCKHSEEFFFLYEYSRSTTNAPSSQMKSYNNSDNNEPATTERITTTPSSIAENVTSEEMEMLYKGNSFFMMPMYISITNFYTFIVVVHFVMILVHLIDLIVIKYLRNDRKTKKIFLIFWMFIYAVFTIIEIMIIIVCWSKPKKCRRCISDGIHPDMLAVWNVNCAIDLLFQLVKGITYILLHLLYLRKLKDLAMREILFAYEFDYLTQLKMAESQKKALKRASLRRKSRSSTQQN